MNVKLVHTSEERALLAQTGALPRFDATQLAGHEADLHLCAVSASDEIQAQCSLWWNKTPTHGDHRVGVIGHYASANDDAASSLLDSAIQVLQKQACTIAIGPMDGNTWRRYRFVLDPGQEPAFFMEPTNPPEWPVQFERAGFQPLAYYFSALNSDLSQTDERMQRVSERMGNLGVALRTARPPEVRDELARIYHLSRVAFARNFLYTELSEAAFFAQYKTVIPHIRPELLLLAERGDELVGYLFAIPDFAQAARGIAIDTFLIKTMAVLPDPSLAGLGGLLAAKVQQDGGSLGFRRCIHALMFESNLSRNLSRHYTVETMRRYVLFSRGLEP